MTATEATTAAGTAEEVVAGERVDALIDELLSEHPPQEADIVEFLGEQFDRGLAWVHFPVGEGGLGLSPKFQRTINERLAAAEQENADLKRRLAAATERTNQVVAQLRFLRQQHERAGSDR